MNAKPQEALRTLITALRPRVIACREVHVPWSGSTSMDDKPIERFQNLERRTDVARKRIGRQGPSLEFRFTRFS